MISPQWGFFALVSYVPDPLGSRLDNLTQALPGVAFRQAHITILPPRPLRVPLEEASRYAREILSQFVPFAIELGAVRRFPVTDVLYLDLAEGAAAVHQLHSALNTGGLAFDEQFEFQPHLTLAGPEASENVDALQSRAEQIWQDMQPKGGFTVREIVALWSEARQTPVWKRLWVHTLGQDQSKTAHVGITGQTS